MVGAVDLLFPRDQLLAGARGLASANGFSLRLLCLARARGPSFPARLPLPMPLRQPRGVNRLGEWRDVRRADSSLVNVRWSFANGSLDNVLVGLESLGLQVFHIEGPLSFFIVGVERVFS